MASASLPSLTPPAVGDLQPYGFGWTWNLPVGWTGDAYFTYYKTDDAQAGPPAALVSEIGRVTLHRVDAQLASGTPVFADAGPLLDDDGLAPIVAEARARWEALGVDVSVLDTVQFQVADLPGLQLGVAMTGVVIIDRDAAGFGWFVDATPGNDGEFAQQVASTEHWATADSAAYGRMDLLTTVMHEMGHLFGLEHVPNGSHDLMEATLGAGMRRVPSLDDASLALAALDGGFLQRHAAWAVDQAFSDSNLCLDLPA